jgi:ribulose 1,5-bisphosphate synthetase/thiazole synthase
MAVTRRNFLQASGIAATAAVSPLAAQQDAGTAEVPLAVQLPPLELPVLRTAEVVVCGGSFAGVSVALELTRAGRKVLLIESRTYLGREIGAHLRPWLPATDPASTPELIRSFAPTIAAGAETPLWMDKVKLAVEDAVLQAGVGLLYASFPVGLHRDGLVIANKSGRQVIRCEALVDATETAMIARLAGASFESAPASARYHRTIEYDGAGELSPWEIRVPRELELAGGVQVHQGYRGAGHVLLEFTMDLPVGAFDYSSWMKREIEARKRTFRLAAWLAANHPAFAKAYLAHTSYELAGPLGAALAGRPGRGLQSFETPVRGVWCLEGARLSSAEQRAFEGPIGRTKLGQVFAKAFLESGASAQRGESFQVRAETGSAPGQYEVREWPAPQPGRRYDRVSASPTAVPVVRDVDVLVAGGGTSGATAAIVAAREGMRTVVTDMNPGLGGTGTIAGVDSYWFGRQVGYSARMTERVAEVHKSIGLPEGKGRHDKWNIEAKMFAQLKEAESAGVDVCFRALTFATVVEQGNRVRGAIAATSYGLLGVLAKVVIDASGDGDLAAFAGAEFVCQSAMDHIGMWHNFAQFVKPGRNANHFTSSVEISNIEDCTRAMLAGRRRGKDCHDHGIYIAPRETRHITGDVTLTLTDLLRHRAWSDVINIHYGNSDMKGKATSQWLSSGLIPPNLDAEISYRMLLPKTLENILIAGKAFSATHDGLAGARFQADLENLGGVVALAAAKAVKEKRSPRNIDVRELQVRLVKEGVLPQSVLTRTLKARRYSDDQLRGLVKAMLADMPLLGYQETYEDEALDKAIPFVEVCTAGPRVVPFLLEALEARPSRSILLAQALALCGSTAGVPLLIEQIERSLRSADRLPPLTRKILHANIPPDQGAMPDAAYLLYSLGMVPDARALRLWSMVADLLSPTPEQFRSRTESPFHYVDAVCYGAERLGSRDALPILAKMHSHELLRNQRMLTGFQADYLVERQAMLELGIAKAMARCGGQKGYEVLIDYLDDNRAALAEQAHLNLCRITGVNYGFDRASWLRWLEKQNGTFELRPLRVDLDAWYEPEILRRLA